MQAYGEVVHEMNSRTSFEAKRIHHQDPQIHTIVPGGSKRVVLLSSKARGSDWDLTVKDEQDSNGVESEDSGFQVDVDSSKIMANDVVVPDMTVTTKKVLVVTFSFSWSEIFCRNLDDWALYLCRVDQSLCCLKMNIEWNDRD